MDFAQQPTPGYPAYSPGNSSGHQPVTQQQNAANTAQAAYPAFEEYHYDSDNGTDTNTASSFGEGEYELPPDLPATATLAEVGQVLWASYGRSKSNWRRFNGNKPVRAVRRFVRRKGKGKGKSSDGKGTGKGKRIGTYLAELPDQEIDTIFLGKGKKGGGKGFRKGKRSTGFGKGRQGNPLDSEGNKMLCFDCGSDQHLRDHCPNKGKGKGAASVQMLAHEAYHYHTAPTLTPVEAPHWTDAFSTHDESMYDDGPLAGLLGTVHPSAPPTHQVFMYTQRTGSSQAAAPPAPAAPAATPAPPATQPQTDANPPDPWMTMGDPWLQRMQDIAAGPTPPQVPAENVPVPDEVMHHHMPAYEPPWLLAQSPPAELPSWSHPDVLGNTLGFTSYAGNDSPLNITTTENMFRGAYGPAPSTLEPPHQPYINSMAQSNATLDDWYNGGDTQPTPAVATMSSLDGQHHSFIDEFWQVQQHNEHMLTKGKLKDKGKGQGSQVIDLGDISEPASTPRPPQSEVEFDGDDRMCSICLEEFEGGDRVIRLVCRHVFHVHCWNDLLIRVDEATESCPNCRGSARIAARFRYISHPVDAYQEPTQAAPTMTSNSSAASFHSVYMMTDADGGRYYHTSTALPDGRMSVIVDVGAWKNLFGRKLVRQAAQLAIAAGYMPEQWEMETPLSIQGVGNGTQQCNWEIRLPIAAEDGNGDTHVHSFETPIVEGTGEDIPGLLGLKSIREKKGILETEPGKEMLTFPGPGGYEIVFAPGYQQFKLEQAPSGHLVIPISDFSKVKKPTGVPPPRIAFHAQETGEQRIGTTGSSASSSGLTPAERIGTASRFQ